MAATWVIIGLGAILRLASFLTNRSLWEDEAFIALNIRGRSFAELFAPLDLNQVAPIGFLLSEKLATRLLGSADWVLRLMPLLASLAALPLFYAVARRTLRIPGALIGLLLFSVSASVVYYAAEVKQYGTDVTVTLVLLWCALRWMEDRESRPRKLLLVVAGALALWCSHPALFILAGIWVAILRARFTWAWRVPNEPRPLGSGGHRLAHACRSFVTLHHRDACSKSGSTINPDAVGKRSDLPLEHSPGHADHGQAITHAHGTRSASLGSSLGSKPLFGTIALASICWGTSFAFCYFVSLRHHVDEQYLLDFWAEGFAPVPVSPSAIGWYVHAFIELFNDPVGLGLSGLGATLAAMGCFALRRASRTALAMLALPILFALLASLLKRYPFQGRLLLFAVPLFLLMIGAGVDLLLRAPARIGRPLAALLGLLLLFQPLRGAVNWLARFPRQEIAWPPREEMKPVMHYLQTHYAAGDGVYVYSYAGPAFAYYAPVYGLADVKFDTFFSRQTDVASLMKTLSLLRGQGGQRRQGDHGGRRVWVVLAHVYSGPGRVNQARAYLDALDRLGRRQDHFAARGADLYLFDFSGEPAPVTLPAAIFAGSRPSTP